MKSVEKYLAIVNPKAGAGRCKKLAADALSSIKNAGLDVDVVETSAPSQATQIANAAYREGRRHFLSVGGDGTAFEVINGLFPKAAKHERVKLGFLPLGTGNSFLRDVAHEDTKQALESLPHQIFRTCDVIQLKHDQGVLYFLNILSIGFTADVCELTNRYLKPLGKAGYGLGVILTMTNLKHYSFGVQIDDKLSWNIPSTFVSFCNSRFTGGNMLMAPKANISDGKLDVVFVQKLGRMQLLKTFPSIFTGTHVNHPAVKTATAKVVDLDVKDHVELMIDGEVIRTIPKQLKVLPGVLDVTT